MDMEYGVSILRLSEVGPMSELDSIVGAVQTTANYVSENLASHAGAEAGTNPSGEEQIDADVWADKLFFDKLSDLDAVGEYVTEERETAVDCGEGYTIAIDPLDGSSNLRSNNPVGTIVGIYDASLPASGRDLVGAIMVLYGPYTTMTVAREDRDKVLRFLLRDGFSEGWGEIEIPDEQTVLGLAGKRGQRSDALEELASELERELKPRYGGATIADLSQVMEYGGLFGYPATDGHPDGKLRVHFESAPLAYIIEAAGGGSTDGSQSLLDVEPDGYHARTQTFLGNEEIIERVESHLS
jgi:fructose-1,6-bisphosphatase I